MFTVALAFAVSVLVSDPKLADTGKLLTLVGTPLPPVTVTTPRHDGPQPTSQPPSRPDPNNVMKLETLMAHNKGVPPTIPIADRSGPDTGIGPSIGPPGVGGINGVVDGDRSVEAAPRPDPPRQKPAAPTTTVDNKPLRISSTVLQGKAIERRTPPYPEIARQIRLPGEVSVEVIISPEGRVESARAVSGHPMFVKPAVEAAFRWRFEPTLLNNVPVRVTGVITFVFKLND
jgi:protein TonB